jgi:hypothetical protein
MKRHKYLFTLAFLFRVGFKIEDKTSVFDIKTKELFIKECRQYPKNVFFVFCDVFLWFGWVITSLKN